MRLGILASHPIQYQAPLFRALARLCDLQVYFAHRQTAQQQGEAGYGTSFEWDVDLLAGYESRYLENRASRPGVDRFRGCDNPGIASEIAANRFDAFVVMGWNLRCYWQAVAACRRNNVPVFARGDSQLSTPRSAIRRVLKALAYPILLGRFDGFFALGRRAATYLRHYGVPQARIWTSPHIVDNAHFSDAARRTTEGETDELRRSLELAPERRVLGYVGRLVPIKRPVDCVRGLAGAGMPDCTLLVVGDGPEREAMVKAARELGVDVRFCGFRNQSELPRYYALCDALILPGDETWGLVANEAMASGKAVVASDAAGCVPDLVEAHETGETFVRGDAASMGRAMRDVIAGVRGNRYRDAIAARMERFSPEAAAGSMMAAISGRDSASMCSGRSN